MPTKRTDTAKRTAAQKKTSSEAASAAARKPARSPSSTPTPKAERKRQARSASASVRTAPVDEKPVRQHKQHHWVRIVVLSIAALALVIVALFVWNRWFRYDDAADIQGEWKVASKQSTMVIDGKNLKITSEVSYAYTLDTWAKTISYSFGSITGQGAYRFSEDRQTLVIEENAQTDWMIALHLEDDPILTGGTAGAGVTKLTKLSNSTSALPQTAVNNTTAEASTIGAAIVEGTATEGSVG